MKIKELIEKLQQMPPDDNTRLIGGIFVYDHALTYNGVSHKPEKKQEESMKLLANKHDDEMRYLVTSVTCKLNLYADSGEVDYLHKAIAVINGEIRKAEAGKENGH